MPRIDSAVFICHGKLPSAVCQAAHALRSSTLCRQFRLLMSWCQYLCVIVFFWIFSMQFLVQNHFCRPMFALTSSTGFGDLPLNFVACHRCLKWLLSFNIQARCKGNNQMWKLAVWGVRTQAWKLTWTTFKLQSGRVLYRFSWSHLLYILKGAKVDWCSAGGQYFTIWTEIV